MTEKCSKCGKLNPKILQGYHVSELCWCGAVKENGKWVWNPIQESIPSSQGDLAIEGLSETGRKNQT